MAPTWFLLTLVRLLLDCDSIHDTLYYYYDFVESLSWMIHGP